MGDKKYVPQNAILVCDKGTVPSKIISYTNIGVTIMAENMCTKGDNVASLNFQPFGSCSCKNGNPCTPTVTDWTNLSDSISIGSNELLLENSELPCTLGGTIKIFYSMRAASTYLPEPEEEEEGFWGTTWSFTKGVGNGLWKGAKGTVVGAKDLVVWAGKHSTPYMLLNPEGFKEQLQKDADTIVAIGNATKKAGTWAYRSSLINYMANPEDWAVQHTNNKEAFDSLMVKASEMDAEDWGDLAGQGLFEVGLGIATAGAGTAVTTAKVADKTVDVARVVDKLDDISDATRTLENIDDAIDTGKAIEKTSPPIPEELGDVVNKKPNKPRKPSKDNPNIDHNRTVKNADGSTTYYDKGGNSVTYSKDGYPDFSEYSIETIDDVSGMNGKYNHDSKLANEIAGFDQTPSGYVWHHVENGRTMQLIPQEVHSNFPHTGGASGLRNGTLP